MAKFFDNRLITLLSSPFIACVALIYGASLIEFKPEGHPLEDELFRFRHTNANVVFKKEPISVKGFLKSPVGINIRKKASKVTLDPSKKKLKTAKKKDIRKKLTFILINEFRKMAIINGLMLNEGDFVGNSRVIRIEKEGVLIDENDAEKWLALE